MIVISTSYDPPADAKARCLASVPSDVDHRYVDAALQDPPLSHFENLLGILNMGAGAPDDEVIVSLDGDDWLLDGDRVPGALARVQAEHDRGALVTYGSFQYADGRPGFARELTAAEWQAPRQAPWVTTHLKTFRAGLLRKIDPEHLRYQGRWLDHARDLALMFPLLEMCGPERARYIPEVLYVYNYANSTEFRGGAEVLAAEREQVRHVRSLPPYARLHAL